MPLLAIFGNNYQGEALPAVASLLLQLQERGAQLAIEPTFLRYLAKAHKAPENITELDLAAMTPDLALCFGGDGTFLAAARAVAPRMIPIMGINTGHLGYLAGATIDEAAHNVDNIVNLDLVVERRRMLEVQCHKLPDSFNRFALNDIAILKRDSASMISIDTALNGQPLALFQADGLVIATPTGSTAYNLSVGGPILAPDCEVFVISPVAPHSLTMRPLVVPDSSRLHIVATSRTPSFRLSVDGHSISLPTGTPLSVAAASHFTLLARPQSHDFIDTLRDKLLWGK